MKTKLDQEEIDILQSHDNNQLKISKTRKIDIQNAVKSAKNTIERKAELNIKLTEKDLRNLKLKEIEIGIPYQNIVTALIHKYLEDKIDLTI
jgi:predicted DNA binding CopG/RHH family protein